MISRVQMQLGIFLSDGKKKEPDTHPAQRVMRPMTRSPSRTESVMRFHCMLLTSLLAWSLCQT